MDHRGLLRSEDSPLRHEKSMVASTNAKAFAFAKVTADNRERGFVSACNVDFAPQPIFLRRQILRGKFHVEVSLWAPLCRRASVAGTLGTWHFKHSVTVRSRRKPASFVSIVACGRDK